MSVATVAVNKKEVAPNESQINKEQLQNAQKQEPGVVAPGFGENPQEQPAAPQQ